MRLLRSALRVFVATALAVALLGGLGGVLLTQPTFSVVPVAGGERERMAGVVTEVFNALWNGLPQQR